MAKCLIILTLFALAIGASAHRWFRHRFDCSGCFTDYGAYESCASLYSASGTACGTQGVKSRRRDYVTGASADCLSKCRRYDLIQYEECVVTGQAPCVEGLICDFSDVATVDANCKPVIAAGTQYSLGLPAAAVTGASALTINSADSSSPDAYGYYFVGPFEASETSPEHFCLEIAYKLPRNVVLKVLRLDGDFGNSADVDGEMRRALSYHNRVHHYIFKDYRSVDMTASVTVKRDFRAGESFKVGLVAFPSEDATASMEIVTYYSITEGRCSQ